jgi:hypothetical protein
MAYDKKPRVLPAFEEVALAISEKDPKLISSWSARRYGLGFLPSPLKELLLEDSNAARALCQDLESHHKARAIAADAEALASGARPLINDGRNTPTG